MREVRLEARAFDPQAAADRLLVAAPEAGGIASFIGKVRAADGVEALELSHYGPLTLPGIEALAERACVRFDLAGLVIIHRIGLLTPQEPIVFVGAAARHRRAAIEAVDFAMDHLKSAAWFWKREKRAGEWHWITPRDADYADRDRWGGKSGAL